MKVKSLFLLSFAFLLTCPWPGVCQIQATREKFFEQEIERCRAKHSNTTTLKFMSRRIFWDTTDQDFHLFLTRCDTTNARDFYYLGKTTRLRIAALQKILTDEDYQEIRKQIGKQFTDPYPKELVFGPKSKRALERATVYTFSQPLVVDNGKLIFLISDSRDGGCTSHVLECYKKVGDHWEQLLHLIGVSTCY